MTEHAPTIVVVGAGLMGRWHCHFARRLGARIHGIVDTDLGRAKLLADAVNSQPYRSLAEVPQTGKALVVHICSPLATHVATAEQALALGHDVVCEKPIAANFQQIDRLLTLAAQLGRRVCPVHQFVMQPAVVDVVNRVRQSSDGLRSISFVFCTAGAAHQPTATLDELILEILPHPLSLLARIFPAAALADAAWTLQHTQSGELHASTSIHKVPIAIFISNSARPTEASCTLYGADSTTSLDFYHGFHVVRRGVPGRTDKLLRPFRNGAALLGAATVNLARRSLRGETAYPGLEALLRVFYAAHTVGAALPFEFDEIRHVYLARDAIANRMSRCN
jgi:predicted dehydrogenase